MADSSSSLSSVWEYDVFLSFRGFDTRKNFVGFLHKELERKNIKTFKDDKELETGSSISRELIQAIEESRFAIVVVSENYASSSWCLEELAKIMECEEKKSLTAIPIFFEVDPSHVRWQKGKFAEHFKKHEKREKAEKVQKWRDALTKLANNSGMDSRSWVDNADLIEEITKNISNRLNSAASSDFTGLVGMDFRMRAVYSLLGLESNDEVRMIGILGMGGVGKTTLATYIYEKISGQFQTCCFVKNVKKIYHDYGPSGLREELVKKIQREDQRNSYLGSNVINQRLGRRKVLLVVDDVDDVRQLNALAKEKGWFGPGSRVIVTTRDKHLLDSCEIKHVYKAKCLADDEALQLFCQFAFKQKFPPDDFQSLSERAVRIAGGLPLALEVFGAFLCDRDDWFWEDAFHELETSLDENVMKILKKSYDGLHKGHKDIFLYVACFFDGQGDVSDVLDVLDEGAKLGLDVLAERCLVSISEFGHVSMHDLLKQMGQELECQQSPYYPGKRKILWKSDEIKKVLRNKQESEAVEAISWYMDKGDELITGENPFEKVPNLRSLKIRSSSIDGETKQQHSQGIRINCPSQLSYLSWLNCPSNILQFRANNLVNLYLRKSKFEKLWEDIPSLENLKKIDVSESKNLKELPDLSKAPNLEVICAQECKSLTEIPPSICSLDKLKTLNLWCCDGLQRVPNNLDMKSLENVCLWFCTSLTMYPESCRGVKRLIHHDLQKKIELPESIGRLSYLEELELRSCESLKHLPETIGDLVSLKRLRVLGCLMLQSIPESIGRLSYLEELELRSCESLKHLPETIGDLVSLKRLRVLGCLMLQSIPESIGRLSFLEELQLTSCESLKHLPETIGDLVSLKRLRVLGCLMLQSIPESIGRLSFLEELQLTSCESLKHLPETIGDLVSLKRLQVLGCLMLQSIPESIGRLSYLEHLELSTCKSLKHLPDTIGDLMSLKSLMLFDCRVLRSLPKTIWKLKSLETFMVTDGRDITEFPNFPETVRGVCFSGTTLAKIPSSIGDLRLLEELNIPRSKRLKNLPRSIYELKCLQKISLWDCPCLESFTSQICGVGRNYEEHDAEVTSSSTQLLPNLEELNISRLGKSNGLSFHCPPLSNFPSLWQLHLINLSMPEISGDLVLLTELEQLDLSGNDFGMMPAGIKRLTKLSWLCIDNCKNLYSLPELPSDIKVISADGCATLAEVSEVFKLNFTNKSFVFANCFKLKEEIQLFYKLMVSMEGDNAWVVLPGCEVPSCFDHRNEGSSLTISLPFGSSSVELMRFSACIVYEGRRKYFGYVEWKCRYMRENCCTSVLCGDLDFSREARVPSRQRYLLRQLSFESSLRSFFHHAAVPSLGHMLFFNGDLRLKEDKEVVFDQISFEFSFPSLISKNDEPVRKIKECGVYLQFTPSPSSSSSLATCDDNATSGHCEPLEAENNAMDGQGEGKELPSTKKQMKSFCAFRVGLSLFLFIFLLLVLRLLWADSATVTSNKLPFL